MEKNIDKSQLEDYYKFSLLLDGVEKFIEKHPDMSYIEFDYYVVHDMTLFSIEPDFDFKQLEKTIQLIRKSIPAIKRIFNKPIVVLKDKDDVLPVENARIINQNTLLHLATHSQYVSNLTKSGVKPRKLLTRIYDDDYSIYENIVFCNFIDDILLLIKKNRRILNSLLYANDAKINFLEKVNHKNYLLALGKLHTGYTRDFSQYLDLSRKMINELSLLNKTISSRQNKPVYKKNKNRNKHLKLKKTNIFLMQKDYRNIYKTYNFLLGNQIKAEKEISIIDYNEISEKYLKYVAMLTIFAVGHFNFEINPQLKINFCLLEASFYFKSWKLDISNNSKQEILLYFSKEETYGIMLTDRVYSIEDSFNYKKDYNLNEIVTVSQIEKDYIERDFVNISFQDIDSFRRIQQIVLRGMVYSDNKRDLCPFCGSFLHKDPRLALYQCVDCMTQIKESVCLETQKPYFYTDNAHLKKYFIKKHDSKYDWSWNYNKEIESSMYFRNITMINKNSEIVCPHCNKVHEIKIN